MFDHDYAGCERPACGRCDAYGDGYSSGKASAHFEIAAVLDASDHAAGCGCQPCITIRAVLEWAGSGLGEVIRWDLHTYVPFSHDWADGKYRLTPTRLAAESAGPPVRRACGLFTGLERSTRLASM